MTPSNNLALLFPGQGAQDPAILDGVRHSDLYQMRYQVVCDALGEDPLKKMQNDFRYIHQNHVSSLLTILASTISLQDFLDSSGQEPDFLAGYSVGQWTTLYAAESICFEELVRIVLRRCELMDECAVKAPGGMLAVIGLERSLVEEICENLRSEGHSIHVANYNSLGQYSLSGTEQALEAAAGPLEAVNPKKLVKLPVTGPWHCPLLEDASRRFRQFLETCEIHSPKKKIIDNVTGNFLPTDRVPLFDQLALHLYRPVLWEDGIRELVASGCSELIEIGYGNVLTKFGFFIDRSAAHSSFYSSRN